MISRKALLNFIFPKLKFAASSSVATLVDYVLYLILVSSLTPVISNLISATTGMLINFLLQKRFIFQLKRKVGATFAISLLSSVFGIGLGTFFIWSLNHLEFFSQHQYITKGIVTAVIFFYNFYMKRYAFERKLF